MTAETTAFEVDYPTFCDRVLRRSFETPVVLLFWANWSPPSRKLVKVLTTVAGARFVLASADVDQSERLASLLGVRKVPVAYLFADGRPIDLVNNADVELVDDMIVDLEEFEGVDLDPAMPSLKTAVEVSKRIWQAVSISNPQDSLALLGLAYVALARGRPNKVERLLSRMTPGDPAVELANPLRLTLGLPADWDIDLDAEAELDPELVAEFDAEIDAEDAIEGPED